MHEIRLLGTANAVWPLLVTLRFAVSLQEVPLKVSIDGVSLLYASFGCPPATNMLLLSIEMMW